MSVVCAQKGGVGVCLFLYFGSVLGPLWLGWVGGPVVHEQCCNYATQDVVCVIKKQHKM